MNFLYETGANVVRKIELQLVLFFFLKNCRANMQRKKESYGEGIPMDIKERVKGNLLSSLHNVNGIVMMRTVGGKAEKW